MKRRLIACAALMLTVGLSGCSKDNCASCPAPADPPPLFVIGDVAVDSPWSIAIDIHAYNIAGTGHKVDQAFADTQELCVRSIPQSAAEDGHQAVQYWGSGDCFSEVVPAFLASETTEFTFYCNGVACSATLHLLNATGARPTGVSANTDSLSSTLTINWNAVADAEWYVLKIRSKANFAGWYGWDYLCVDTNAITLPLALNYTQMNDVNIYVASGTGPRPDDQGATRNLSGRHIKGSIYSVSYDAHTYLEISPYGAAGNDHREEPIDVPSLGELIRQRD